MTFLKLAKTQLLSRDWSKTTVGFLCLKSQCYNIALEGRENSRKMLKARQSLVSSPSLSLEFHLPQASWSLGHISLMKLSLAKAGDREVGTKSLVWQPTTCCLWPVFVAWLIRSSLESLGPTSAYSPHRRGTKWCLHPVCSYVEASS